MEAQITKDVVPFNFLTPTRIIRDAILIVRSPTPVVVSEGANTIDVGRAMLVQTEPRTRLNTGTWETIGVGLGMWSENSGGVYGGDQRTPKELNGPYKDDPAPTSFVSKAGYRLPCFD
ncbi:hypothetical protein HN51_025791 [Arachis hypogaea]|uniref:Uncharacterized protein n=1 Tax=Arachis hypogaea TaxID=3818 RepID=A0A445CF74_ARAHY|nr:hypothetical protein Ahy_A07g036090 [Arachis hypogaea]